MVAVLHTPINPCIKHSENVCGENHDWMDGWKDYLLQNRTEIWCLNTQMGCQHEHQVHLCLR